MTILVSNEAARRIFIARQGLSSPPGRALNKQGLLQLITDLGFVQVDSIGTVEREPVFTLYKQFTVPVDALTKAWRGTLDW